MEALMNFIQSENLNAEVLIINDGGKDATAKIVEEKLKKYPAIRFINRAKNIGKGASVREGIATSSGNVIIFTDADLPYGTKHFKEMIEFLRSWKADLVIANRHLWSTWQVDQFGISTVRRLTHWSFGFLVRNLLHLRFSDTQAGLKGMSHKAAGVILPKLNINGFAFDLELLVEAQKAGLKIQEVPVVLENAGQSNIKIARDSLRMLIDIIKIWLSY
ncbi:hypothetical protein A2661_00600 [Candidatus Giovannonibacteria bacterium RIFCSPHIGHO2_01_FULL_45_24]|uniref:Glycosyltransferase 2-like domain-containing protein n=1 Tax=Candidatus Giovannonibacteria bacterium RIFCSPLOWO2_01_FULL_46_32 TaxID=1798353 RepID=A0A1F5XGX9_9BACT|nr:MAG: hypothetical protein A2661_00600 [Candidatus Giovannonibacteria bacterium RIFCSPHIGHO2_01_FULL_45_24]OGF87076.1 MAG: hypothetical protein A3B19_01440 [Candidatus Giovannonibacteria bacterium RIFCSPLOWO2_01_FULL_46_32]